MKRTIIIVLLIISLIVFLTKCNCISNIVSLLNNNSGAIQAICVVILIVVTWWYAYTTKKMSITMGSEFQLKTIPYLAILNEVHWNYEISTENDYSNIQFVFKLKNVGQTPIEFICDEVKVGEILFHQEKFKCILFPNQTMDFTSGFNKIPSLKDLKNPEDIILKDIYVKFIFNNKGISSNKYYISRKNDIVGNRFFITNDDFGEIR